MNKQDDVCLTIRDLSARTGVSIRTIHYYLAAGLLPSPGARGKNATYGEEHLLRLQLVRRLVEQRVPLAEIRDHLEGLSVEELRALLAEEETRQRRLAEARRASTPREYVATLLERSWSTLPAASVRRHALFDRSSDELESRLEVVPMRLAPLPEPESGAGPLRWRLSPGIDLIAERETYARHRQLIEQLIRVARAMLSELGR